MGNATSVILVERHFVITEYAAFCILAVIKIK